MRFFAGESVFFVFFYAGLLLPNLPRFVISSLIQKFLWSLFTQLVPFSSDFITTDTTQKLVAVAMPIWLTITSFIISYFGTFKQGDTLPLNLTNFLQFSNVTKRSNYLSPKTRNLQLKVGLIPGSTSFFRQNIKNIKKP